MVDGSAVVRRWLDEEDGGARGGNERLEDVRAWLQCTAALLKEGAEAWWL
ncbi:hypothetical protein SESBI_20162 [Sesbania bispinosa]|nr:hypothetical protein SESBI_20162 [Sesbania bispinosa]